MKMDKSFDKVIFKIARYDDRRLGEEVIAFFPGAPANHGRVMCYSHVGQHCEASYDFYLKKCRPCPAEAYCPLKKELEDVFGYRFRIMKRMTRKDLEEAWRRK